MTRAPIHPGEVLADELAELNIAPTEFAGLVDVSPTVMEELLAGSRPITADLALRLGHWFETSAQFWLNLQNAHDIRQARAADGTRIDDLPTRSQRAFKPTG